MPDSEQTPDAPPLCPWCEKPLTPDERPFNVCGSCAHAFASGTEDERWAGKKSEEEAKE